MTPEYQVNRSVVIQGMVNDACEVSGDLLASETDILAIDEIRK